LKRKIEMMKTKMLNRTVTTALILLLSLSILSVVNIMPAHATVSIIYMSPTSGPVGTPVTLNGTITTYAGSWNIIFDSDADSAWDAGEYIQTGTAVGTSVSTTFVVPNSINSTRTLWLRDVITNESAPAQFIVGTTWYISLDKTVVQENTTLVNIITNVTGGESNKEYGLNVTVTTPASTTVYFNDTVHLSNTTDTGRGENTTLYYPANFTTGASTNYTGTYTVRLNSTFASTSFNVILTNASTYSRGQVVNVTTAGWINATGQGYTGEINGTTAVYIVIKKPDSTNVTGYPKVANVTGGVANDTWTIPADAPLGNYTVIVYNSTWQLGKPVLDNSTFEISAAGILQFTNITYPAAEYQRTDKATWKFNVTYLGGGNFTSANATAKPVRLYCNGSIVETFNAGYSGVGGDWWANWTIPKDASLGSGYNFTIVANSWNDTNGNTGPPTTFTSSNFTIIASQLSVAWNNWTLQNYNGSATPVSWQNRTLTQSIGFRVTYNDTSALTDVLAQSINVTVWNGTYTVANLTIGAGVTYNSTSQNWTATWTIPYNAYNATFTSTANSTYTFCLLSNKTADSNGNTGPWEAGGSNSTVWSVAPAVVTCTSISATASSYARGTTATIYFNATYPDGSPVTTGNATITLTQTDGTNITRWATYSATALRFQVTYYLDFEAPLGTWTATLAVSALDDSNWPLPSTWFPGNVGPTVTRTTTFDVTESTTLMEILSGVEDLEAKLDNTTFGLNAIKTAVDQVQTTLNAVGTKVDNIYNEVTNSTHGLAAIKNAVDAINFTGLETKVDAIKLETDTINWTDIATIKGYVQVINWTDITTIKSYVQVINWTDIAAIKTELGQVPKKDWWDLVHLVNFHNMVQFHAGAYSTTAPTSTNPVNLAKSSKVTLTVRATDDATASFKVNVYIYDGTAWQPLSFSVPGIASADCAATVEFTTGADGTFYFETTGATFTAFIYSAESAP
jgi:hypothetical protein